MGYRKLASRPDDWFDRRYLWISNGERNKDAGKLD